MNENQMGALPKKMNLAGFSQAMTARGGVMAGQVCCDVYRGMPYKIDFVRSGAFGKASFTLTFQFAEALPKEMLKNLRGSLKRDMKLTVRAVAGNRLSLAVTFKGASLFYQKLDLLLDTVAREMANFGCRIPAACSVCGQPEPDAYALHGNAYTPVHAGCVQAFLGQEVGKAWENELNGNYGLGLLGALLGGIAGTLPSVLAAVILNVISAWLCALVPLAAYYGYKLLKGKMNAAAPACTVVVSILMIPVLDYFVAMVLVFREYSLLLSPMDYILLFQEAPSDFILELAQTALFIILGIVVVFGIIRLGNQHVYQNANMTGATIRPIDV